MKISSSNPNKNNFGPAIKAGQQKSSPNPEQTSQAKPVFAQAIKGSILKNTDLNFQQLIDQVRTMGQNFISGPEEETLNLYKESIKLFLRELKNSFLSLKEELGAKKNGEQKVYQLLSSIDEDVKELTKETLSENKATELLYALDDVRGLVLDILG